MARRTMCSNSPSASRLIPQLGPAISRLTTPKTYNANNTTDRRWLFDSDVVLHSQGKDEGMDTAQHDGPRWWTRWGLRGHSSPAEAHVARWKAAWLRGANATWHDQSKAINPYDSEMQRAAWNAGAKWARENPDRRAPRTGRFAHPQRRASDTKLPSMVKRAVAVSATTLTLYAISRTLWRVKATPEDSS